MIAGKRPDRRRTRTGKREGYGTVSNNEVCVGLQSGNDKSSNENNKRKNDERGQVNGRGQSRRRKHKAVAKRRVKKNTLFRPVEKEDFS